MTTCGPTLKFLVLILIGIGFSLCPCSSLVFALEGAKKYTSPPWPLSPSFSDASNCTAKKLGLSPDPVYLAACPYLWFGELQGDGGFPRQAEDLLYHYGSPDFRRLLEFDRKMINKEVAGVGVGGYLLPSGEFFSYTFENAEFDEAKGIAKVSTKVNDKPVRYYVKLVLVKGSWRFDDFLPFYERQPPQKTLRDLLGVYRSWKDEMR